MNRFAAILGSLFLALELLTAAEPVNLLVDGKLEKPHGWKFDLANLTPGNDTQPAQVIFTGSKYGCIFRHIPVTAAWPQELVMELTYRLVPALPTKKPFQLSAEFFDGLDKKIEGKDKLVQLIPNQPDWQTATLGFQIPVDTRSIRVKVQCFSQGVLDIQQWRLFAEGLDAASAAAMGIDLDGLIMPAQLTPSPQAAAHVRYFPAVPFQIDSPFWDNLEKFTLKNSGHNKSAPTEKDLDAYFKIACDQDAIYVLMVARDDVLNVDSEPVHERDSFEFYLNPTGAVDKGGGYQFKDMQVIATCDPTRKMAPVLGGRSLIGRTPVPEIINRVEKDVISMLLRVPFKTDGWDFSPFPGMRFTANVKYNDADTQPQENVYSFADDPNNMSWNNTAAFVPFDIVSDVPLPYAPVRLPYLSDVKAPVNPNHDGFFNLEHGDCAKGMDGFSFWLSPGWITSGVDDQQPFNGRPSLCLDSSKLHAKLDDSAVLVGSMFNVQPGETIVFEFYAKYSGSGAPPMPSFRILSRCNWLVVGGGAISPNALTGEWQRYQGTFVVPKEFCGINRQVRIWGSFNNMRSNKIWIAERKLSRKTPIPLDAKIAAPTMFSHFDADDAAKKLILDFHNSGDSKTYFTKAVISDYLSGASKVSAEWDLEIDQDKTKSIDWAFSLSEKGFFDASLCVYAKRDGTLLMQRNLAFSVGTGLDGYVSPFFGIWNGDYRIPSYDSTGEFYRFIKRCGIDKYFIGGAGEELSPGKYDFDLSGIPIDGFKQAGFEISSKVMESSFGKKEQDQDSDLIYSKCIQTARQFVGKIDDLCYANEPNLSFGWTTGPDGREWANAYRIAYNAFKNGNPEIIVSLGDLNAIPVDYLRDYHSINGEFFHDNIVGIHAYRSSYDKDAFEQFLKERQGVSDLFPDSEVRDTESGLVYKNYPVAMNLTAKKTPTLLCAGISRHYFYDMVDMFSPYGDSSPLIPIVMFQTFMLKDAVPLGKFDAGNNVIGFLFRKGDTDLAILWNISGKGSATIPLRPGAVMYDQFGNAVSEPAPADIQLQDTYVRYVLGVDGEAVKKGFSFQDAFVQAPGKVKPTGFVTNPYLILEPSARMFDREIVVGEEIGIPVVVRNDSGRDFEIQFEANSTDMLTSRVEPPTMLLPKNSKSKIEVKLLAKGDFNRVPLVVGGTTEGGKLVPLTVTTSTAKPITVAGYSRMVLVKNNLPEAQDAALALSLWGFYFTPPGAALKLDAGEMQTMPFAVALDKAHPRNKGEAPVNMCQHQYGINVKTPDYEYSKFATYYEMVAGKEEKLAPGDFLEMQHSLKPESLSAESFETQISIRRGPDYLRVLAKIHDPSPVQSGNVGDIYKDGDCLVLGFDAGELENKAQYGNDDFELGFTVKPDGKGEAYRWNGQYGLEGATTVSELLRSATRDGEWLMYDIVIPIAMIKMPEGRSDIGFSILAINRTKDGKTEYCRFGDGLEQNRDISKFGILKF
jgi:hypothetical protein